MPIPDRAATGFAANLNTLSNRLNIPILGLNMNSQMTDDAATEIPIVDEYIVRKKPIPFNFSLANKAKNSEKMIPIGTVYRTNNPVAFILLRNAEDSSK